MSTEMVDSRDIARIIKRNGLLIFLTIALSAAIAIEIAFYVPRSYKAKAVLNIQASYFQNPLVSDFVREVNDPAEQAAQRQALLRLALSEQFLDSLGERYHLFKYAADNRFRVIEREGLLKKIEYYSLGPTIFQISVIANDPVVSYQMTREVLDQMRNTLFEQRLGNLIRTRDAIQKHIQSLRFTLKDIMSPLVSLKIKLEKIEADIQTLTSQFSDKHPEVLRLQKQGESIRNLIKNFSSKQDSQSDDSPQAVLNMSSKQTSEDVFNDLLKKLNYLNIVLDMERDRDNLPYLGVIEQPTIPTGSFAPDKKLFLMFGFGVGVVLAGILVLFRELKKGTFLSAEYASQTFGVEFLGELPQMRASGGALLLGASSNEAKKSLLLPRTEKPGA